MHYVRQHSTWHGKARDILRNIVGLDNILRVLASELSPLTQLNVQFYPRLLAASLVHREQSKHSGGSLDEHYPER